MKDLSDWRDEIDRLDREVVDILNRRAECVLGLAPLKRERGMHVREPNRERVVMGNVVASNQGPLPDRSIERIYETVMREMRSVQRKRDD